MSDLRPALKPVRRVFRQRASHADEISTGRLNRIRRDPGIIRETGGYDPAVLPRLEP